jgi:uncharacterized membrane protein
MENLVWILAGVLIISSVWLAQAVSQWWLLLAVLIGAYLAVSGHTGSCVVKRFLSRKSGMEEDHHDDSGD